MKKFYLNENEEAVFKINGKEVTVSKLTVGPTDAEEIISKSDALFSNRKSREKSYKLYSEDMNRGEWKTNGETIKFSSDGALLDGRNRLCAVTLGDTKIDFLAVGNVDRDVVDTIDIGMKRTLEHALKMQSSSYETGSASIVKMKLELDSRQMSQEASEVALGISRIDAVHEYENNIEKYQKANSFSKDIWTLSHKALNRPEIGAMYLHLTETLKWDEGIVQEFFHKLATPQEGSIFWRTYEKLRNKKVCRGKDRFLAYIPCWNAFIKGARTRKTYKTGDWFISSATD